MSGGPAIVRQVAADGGQETARFHYETREEAEAFAEKARRNMGGCFHYFVEDADAMLAKRAEKEDSDE